jgi:transposase-like protein
MTIRPAIFKWRQTEPELILCAVRWYLRYWLSLRDVEELLDERGLGADHTTVWRWVQPYGPKMEQRMRRHLKPANKSWRADETYIRVKGRRCYLYRAIDSSGATIDFLLSALRDAAKRLFRKALSDRCHAQPRVINTDLAPIYGSAIPNIKKEGTLRRGCRHRPVQYLNNLLEQGHRAIQRRVNAKGFREFQAARRTIQGYEAMNMLRKGQARWVGKTDVRRLWFSEIDLLVLGRRTTRLSHPPHQPARSCGER